MIRIFPLLVLMSYNVASRVSYTFFLFFSRWGKDVFVCFVNLYRIKLSTAELDREMVEKEGVTVGVGVLVQPYKPSSHDSLPPERERAVS